MLLPEKLTASLIEPSEPVFTLLMVAPLGMIAACTGALTSTAAGRVGPTAPSSDWNQMEPIPGDPVVGTLGGTMFGTACAAAGGVPAPAWTAPRGKLPFGTSRPSSDTSQVPPSGPSSRT